MHPECCRWASNAALPRHARRDAAPRRLLPGEWRGGLAVLGERSVHRLRPLCIPRLRSDGGVQYQYCSKGCPQRHPGECPSPFVCRQSPLRDGGTVCSPCPTRLSPRWASRAAPIRSAARRGSICQPPTALPSTGVAWQDGYCQENCTLGGNTCPAGSACVDSPPTNRCLKSCRVGGGDCRPGYTCAPRAEGNVCVPNCYTDADCAAATTSSAACATTSAWRTPGLGRTVGRSVCA